MSEEQNKLGAMFEKALANRAAKLQEQAKAEVEEKEQETDESKEKDNPKEIKPEEVQDEIIEEELENVGELEKESEEEFEEVIEETNKEKIEEKKRKEEKNQSIKPVEHRRIPFFRDSRQTTMISIDKLENYPDQPFKEYSEEKELEMIDSIKVNGIIQDLIVRPLPNGNYQILSGHNRKNCAIKAGLTELPCKIKDVDDDTAKLMLVDTNLVQRKELYPSETAKALKIKKDVYKKKDVKSDFFDEISKEQNMSRGNIQRYLRLNYLIPELLERVDSKSMSIKIAEDLSFLSEKEQITLNQTMEARGFKVNSDQAKRLRDESSNNNLTDDTLTNILVNTDKNLKSDIELKFTKKEVEKYFKDFDNVEEIKDFIVSILEDLIAPPKEVKQDG